MHLVVLLPVRRQVLLDQERRRDVLQRQLLQERELQGQLLLQLGGAIIELQRVWVKRRILPGVHFLQQLPLEWPVREQSQRRRAVLLVEPVQKRQLQGRAVLQLQRQGLGVQHLHLERRLQPVCVRILPVRRQVLQQNVRREHLLGVKPVCERRLQGRAVLRRQRHARRRVCRVLVWMVQRQAWGLQNVRSVTPTVQQRQVHLDHGAADAPNAPTHPSMVTAAPADADAVCPPAPGCDVPRWKRAVHE